MKAKTAYTIINKPAGELFRFLADPENHPKWATEFIKELKKENGNYKVLTPFGEQHYRAVADAKTGVVDLYSGQTEDQMALFPTRVVPLGEDRSAFLFTMFGEGMPDELFGKQFRSLQRELDQLQAIFS